MKEFWVYAGVGASLIAAMSIGLRTGWIFAIIGLGAVVAGSLLFSASGLSIVARIAGAWCFLVVSLWVLLAQFEDGPWVALPVSVLFGSLGFLIWLAGSTMILHHLQRTDTTA